MERLASEKAEQFAYLENMISGEDKEKLQTCFNDLDALAEIGND